MLTNYSSDAFSLPLSYSDVLAMFFVKGRTIASLITRYTKYVAGALVCIR